jgi:hypothetical protein
MSMADDPLAYRWMAKIEGCENRVYHFTFPESNAQTPGAAQPTTFTRTNQSPALNVTPAAVDYIANLHTITAQAFGIRDFNAGDISLNYAIIANVFGHNRGNANRHIVSSMKLTSKRASLDITTASPANLPEGYVLPAAWQCAENGFNHW